MKSSNCHFVHKNIFKCHFLQKKYLKKVILYNKELKNALLAIYSEGFGCITSFVKIRVAASTKTVYIHNLGHIVK